MALSPILTVLDAIVPKNKRCVIFGCEGGAKFNGNPRELFEYMAARPEWQPYFITRSRSVYSSVSARHPGKALWALSLRALWIGLQARFYVVSHSWKDVRPLGFISRRKVIHLTHGIPLKTMGFAKRHPNIVRMKRDVKRNAFLACASEFEGKLWQKAYHLSERDIWVTGYPRADLLLNKDDTRLPYLAKKTVLYAPTYRDWAAREDYTPVPDLNLERLAEILERHDAQLLIRPHYYEVNAASRTVAAINSPRVHIADVKVFPDAVKLLPHVDILITDYSSIYFDFLLVNKPIIFVPTDLDRYKKERGLFLDYDAHTPGAKVVTSEPFLDALDKELAGADPYQADREKLRDLLHQYQHGGSCARIAEQIARHS